MNTSARTTLAAYAVLLLAGGISVSIPMEQSVPSAQAGTINAEGTVVNDLPSDSLPVYQNDGFHSQYDTIFRIDRNDLELINKLPTASPEFD